MKVEEKLCWERMPEFGFWRVITRKYAGFTGFHFPQHIVQQFPAESNDKISFNRELAKRLIQKNLCGTRVSLC
jgi:hypothetical protein